MRGYYEVKVLDTEIHFFRPFEVDHINIATILKFQVKDNFHIVTDVRFSSPEAVFYFISVAYSRVLLDSSMIAFKTQMFEKLTFAFNKWRNNWEDKYNPYGLYDHVDKKLMKHQVDCIWRATYKRVNLFALEQGTGKEQPVDSKIITDEGVKLMGDVKVGDKVIGSDGKPCSVTGVFPQGVKDVYGVHLSDGSYIECGLDHLWIVVSNMAAKEHKTRKVKSTKDLIDGGLFKNGFPNRPKWHIPYTDPVEFKSKDYGVLDPYLLGLLLGDGCFRSTVSFTTIDTELLDEIKRLLPYNGVSINKGHHDNYNYRVVVKRINNRNPLFVDLEKLGLMNKLSHEKFIPSQYLHNSIDVRLSILQGLMDTDGNVNSKYGNRISFSTVSPELANQVSWIVKSLGGHSTTYLSKRKGKRDCYELSILFENGITPFRLNRHIEKIKPKQRVKRRNIVKIEKLPPKEQQCISVDSYDNSYLTEDFVVTHNTLTAASITKMFNINRTLVISPSLVKWNWLKDLSDEFGFEEHTFTVLDAKKTVKAIIDEKWVIVNYESIAKFKKEIIFQDVGHIIIDEIHAIKNTKSKKFQNVKMILDHFPKARVTMLTGTPITNRIMDLYSYIKLARVPILSTSKYGFRDKFAKVMGNKVVGVKNVEELRGSLSNFMIRKKTSDCIDLPAVRHKKCYIGDEIKSESKYFEVLEETRLAKERLDELKIEHQIRKDLGDVVGAKKIQREMFVEKGKARSNIITLNKLCAISKVPSTIKMIQDLIDEGEKVIIFSQFKEPLHKLKYKFIGKCVYIDGSVPALERQQEIEKFKKDKKIMVYIAQIVAGGIGVNLVNSANVFFLDLPFTSDKIEQAYRRAVRKGQTREVNINYMILKDSIDEKIFGLVKSKAKDISDVIDGGESDMDYSKIEDRLLDDLFGVKQKGFREV